MKNYITPREMGSAIFIPSCDPIERPVSRRHVSGFALLVVAGAFVLAAVAVGVTL